MTRKFATPYIIFYPMVATDGLPFPINRFVREIQQGRFREQFAWRGDLVVVKYKDSEYKEMYSISMADFPIIKNYLSTHAPYQVLPTLNN